MLQGVMMEALKRYEKYMSDADVMEGMTPVSDPRETNARVARDRYAYERDVIRPFERELIKKLDDTSMVDDAPEVAERSAQISEDINKRNLSRYGIQETAAVRSGRASTNKIARSLGTVNAVNNARLNQSSYRTSLLSSLVGAATNINTSSLNALASSAQNQTSRNMAFTNAAAAAKQQRYGFIGQITSMI